MYICIGHFSLLFDSCPLNLIFSMIIFQTVRYSVSARRIICPALKIKFPTPTRKSRNVPRVPRVPEPEPVHDPPV